MTRHYKYSPSAGKNIRITVVNKPKVSNAKLWEKNSFVKVPLQNAEAVAKIVRSSKQFLVWVLLLHLTWRDKAPTVSLPNGILQRHGVHRHTKRLALAKLERAGIITVTRKPGRAPVIRLH
jgi:hypothetical protein